MSKVNMKKSSLIIILTLILGLSLFIFSVGESKPEESNPIVLIHQVIDQLLGIEAKIDNLDTSGLDITGLEALTADVHDHVDELEPYLTGIESSITGVEETLGSLGTALSQVDTDLVLISADIEQMRQSVETEWMILLNKQIMILSGEHGLILAQISVLMTENQALKTEILNVLNAPGGPSGSQIT